eukprot:scaffold136783_cov19-Tisochrysis_lutea.AAC.1
MARSSALGCSTLCCHFVCCASQGRMRVKHACMSAALALCLQVTGDRTRLLLLVLCSQATDDRTELEKVIHKSDVDAVADAVARGSCSLREL